MADSITPDSTDATFVVDFWRNFDLDGKRLMLDKQVILYMLGSYFTII